MIYSVSKQKIIDEALRLFSENGYEATSISRIAEAVGIRKASLYSHFKSKQEILDTIVKQLIEQYEEISLFANTDWENEKESHKEYIYYTEEDIIQMIRGQYELILKNPMFVMARKMMTVEQFRNYELRELYNRIFYEDILVFHKGLIQYLIRNGIFIEEDAEIMAHQFVSTISMQISRMQRNPECEEDALRIIEEHIKHMCKMYCKK